MICQKCLFYESKNKQAVVQHAKFCDGSGVTKWNCKLCNLKFQNRSSFQLHNKDKGHSPIDFTDKEKQQGLFLCAFCKRASKTKGANTSHSKHCNANPNRIPGSNKGIRRTEEEKKNLSDNMKQRHANGRAAKWKNPSLYESYAENFFQKVIDNDFSDKEVSREFPLEKYSFDFAWPHKMKAIEIDGQQHERYQHQKDSDARKDSLAKEKGWDVLRIKWREMYAEPKKFISLANNFIGE